MKNQHPYLRLSWKNMLLFLGFIVFHSCVDTIQLDLPKDATDAIVIQAKLVKGNPSKLDVQVQRLFSFGPSTRDLVNVREVFLVDSEDSRVEVTRVGDGRYALEIPDENPMLSVEFYRSYRLEVFLADGRRFESTPEQLFPVPEMDSVNFNFLRDLVVDPVNPENFRLASFAQYSINTPLIIEGQPERSRVRWLMERTYKLTELPREGEERKTCYIRDPVSVLRPKSFDGTLYNADYLLGHTLYAELTEGLYYPEGYYTTIYQESLSKGAHTYFAQIQESVLRDGNMFESPAGPVISNFRNVDDSNDPVYGYFYVTERDTIHRYTPPSLVNSPDTFCLRPFDFIPDVCVDCLTASRSDTVPPPFWKE